MNKPRMREGFVSDDEPVIDVDINRPPSSFENEPQQTRSDGDGRAKLASRPIEPPQEEAMPDAPPVAPPVVPVTWPFTYKLMYRPLRMNRGEEINELTFREPNTRDLLEQGNPINLRVDPIARTFDVHIDDVKMIHLLGNLCTDKRIQSAHLGDLHPQDYVNIANKLRRFFRPDWHMVNF